MQSLTRKYRGLHRNPCNENRDPVMRIGVPCKENRVFPVTIDSQGIPCELYRVWVCSVDITNNHHIIINFDLYKNQIENPDKLTLCKSLSLIFGQIL